MTSTQPSQRYYKVLHAHQSYFFQQVGEDVATLHWGGKILRFADGQDVTFSDIEIEETPSLSADEMIARLRVDASRPNSIRFYDSVARDEEEEDALLAVFLFHTGKTDYNCPPYWVPIIHLTLVALLDLALNHQLEALV